ncbi:hypothetical protein DSLASN_19920 [Desulfoluna limicola]|uniref:histidine kinase n=2 Tax=Desulfoluna limicola TaxID=2810562 RepID=A0ABN6F3Z2_9BACT|nr:hypothetical protein DSLASN_19920 [Desulfoluna limicola]
MSHTGCIADGLEFLKSHSPDVLILDLNPKGGNGIGVVRTIRSTYPGLPIIVLTSGENEDTATDVQGFGAQDYLVKGKFDAAMLNRSVRYAIDCKNRDMALSKHQTLLHTFIDALDHPLMLIDSDSGDITMANAKARKLFSGILFSGDAACDPTGPAPLPGVLAELIEQVKTRQTVISRYVNMTLEKGRQIRLAFYGCPLPSSSDSSGRVVLYGHDITWLSKLQPDWPVLVTAMEQFPEAVLIMDEDRTIRYVNPAFETQFGYSNAEINGKSPNLLIPVKQLPDLDALIRQSIEHGEAWAESLVCRKKDLSLLEVNVRVSPVFDDLGRLINIVAVTQDVTGKKRLKSIEEASSMTENLGSIFSGIRHEIGNPMNSIKMALTVLNKNLGHYPEATIQEFIERSLNEVERVESLLKEFKNFSLFESPSVEKNRIDVILQGFLGGMKKKESARHIAVSGPPVRDRKEVWAYTDPQALEQVLATLTDNAIDALESTAQPRIQFRLTESAGLVHLDISDNGCGMTEDQQKALFTPFNTSKMNGTGLGLVMVKKMLARMDTTIRIKSSPEAGTCVTLAIPTEKNRH